MTSAAPVRMLNGVSQSHQPPAYCRPSTCTPCRMAPSAMPCASAASSEPPVKARSQRLRSRCECQRNSKATPRNTSPSSIAIIGRVERRHQHRIGQRKRRHQAAAAKHQPGFVAVPDRRDAVHDDVAIAPFRKQRKQDAEAEIKTVHHDVDEHGEGDDERPEDGEVDGEIHRAPSGFAPAAGVMPAARAGTSCDGPCSPGCGGAAIKRRR